MTTSADLLQKARPPADDEIIEKALAELDSKIWQWTDALKSAHSQLRAAFAVRPPSAAAPPPPPPSAPASAPVRPSAALFETLGTSLSEAAAAAHLPKPPPLPDWATRSGAGAAGAEPAWPTPPPPPSSRAEAPAADAEAEQKAMEWPQWPPAPAAQEPAADGGTGVVPWPTSAPSWQPTSAGSAGGAGGAAPQAQGWPAWTPTTSGGGAGPVPAQGGAKKAAPGSNVRASKAPKAVRPPVPDGPTPEERAKKAAEEEERLSQLEEAIARRVRLLRRLDPDTAIEKLIEKATQSAAEAATTPKEDKSSSSSWWRRK